MTTLPLLKQGLFVKSQVILFVAGMHKAKSVLCALIVDKEDILNRICIAHLLSLLLLKRKGKSAIVVFPRGSKSKILSDKETSSDFNTLNTRLLQILGLALTGKDQGLKPFWSPACTEISQSLWLPTETDCAGLHSSLSKSLWTTTTSNSWFSTQKLENPAQMNSQKTFSPSYMFIRTEKWEKEGIRARKIKLYPTVDQKKLLKSWMGTARYVYNRALVYSKETKVFDWKQLRNRFVTAKHRDGSINDQVQPWELKTPKDIRAGSVRDMSKAYKTAFSQLRSGNITKFGLNFRSKKKDFSLEIPGKSVSIINNKLKLFPSFMTGTIKTANDKSLRELDVVDHDCRLGCIRGNWYITVPMKVSGNEDKSPLFEACALDPGVRKFQTIYSEHKAVKISIDKRVIANLQAKMDLFRSLRAKKIISKKRQSNRERRVFNRLDRLIDDMHFKTIKSITDDYSTIFLPSFESQDMARKNRYGNRNLLQLKHYLFKTRLLDKCALLKNTNVEVCTEEYTSKTCTGCGVLNHSLGSSERFNCSHCSLSLDRDVNGARNILIKCISEY